ncbi:class I adenylate-forming enzyme family protein [Devosia sp. A449]
MTDFIASRAEAKPHSLMLGDRQGRWTWQEMVRDARRLAAGLVSRSIGKGDRVVVMARNSAWHPLVLQACALIEAVFVPINPDYKELEASRIISHCEPGIVLYDEYAQVVALQVAAEHSNSRFERLDDALFAQNKVAFSPAGAGSTLLIVYTSGTTGMPKGVMHSQANFVAAGEAFVQRLHLQSDEHMLSILPMFHINALFYSIAGAWAAGAALFIEPRFSASSFWKTVDSHKITQTNIIEAIAAILLNRPDDEYRPDHTLRKIYGVRYGMMQPLRTRFGIPHLIGGYAMTEIPGILGTPYAGDTPPGSMGQLSIHPDPARAWAKCRVVDNDGNVVEDGEPGELQVSTPSAMQGYFRDPEQTAASWQEGWFRTGDLVRRDSDGFYYFLSRLKDIIRRRGENISGAELDQVLTQHPSVLLGAAIGVDSPFGDQDILMAVVPKPGATLEPQDIVAWCDAKLASIKRPRFVAIVDSLPLTPTHKVAKAAMRQNSAQLLEKSAEFG